MSSSEFSTLSLHDALPISGKAPEIGLLDRMLGVAIDDAAVMRPHDIDLVRHQLDRHPRRPPDEIGRSDVEARSEEHTSELQSRFDLVCRLLLEKKNINKYF